MRLHLFEFEDLPWFPDVIRKGGTDYLRYFLIHTQLYKPAVTLLSDALEATGQRKIVDLCSGGGGYILEVYDQLQRGSANQISITLTDKFPNLESFRLLEQKTGGAINYIEHPVDATDVPETLRGFRTMFSAVHHFKPGQVRQIIKNATEAEEPIALFDGGERGLFPILGMIVVHPIAFLLFTPFFRPFKISRIFFTYILPLIPLYTIWDGAVSVLRMYRPDELLEIAQSVDGGRYAWKSGKTKNRFGIRASYLIGYPKTTL